MAVPLHNRSGQISVSGPVKSIPIGMDAENIIIKNGGPNYCVISFDEEEPMEFFGFAESYYLASNEVINIPNPGRHQQINFTSKPGCVIHYLFA